MKYKYLITSIFFIFLSLDSDQGKMDSLLQQLREPIKPRAKLEVLDSLTRQMIRNDHENQMDYLWQYIDLAKELGEYDKAASKSRFIVQQYIYKDQIDSAHALIDKMLSFKDKFKSPKSEAHMLLKRGGAFYADLDYVSAIPYYDRAAELFMISQDSIFAADAHYFSGEANSALAQFVEAINQYERAYNLYLELKDYSYVFYVGKGLSLIYRRNGLHEQADQKNEELIRFCEDLDDKDALTLIYLNQGIDAIQDGNFAEAKKIIDLLGPIIKDIEDQGQKKRKQYRYLGLQMFYYLRVKDTHRADDFYKKLLQFENEFNEKPVVADYLFAKVEYLKNKEKYSQALHLLKEYEEANKSAIPYSYSSLRGQKLLADLYREIQDYQKADLHQRNYTEVKDSLNALATATAYIYHQSKFDVAQKERRLKKMEIDSDQKAKVFQTWVLSLGSAMVLVIVLGCCFWRRNLCKQKEMTRIIAEGKQDLTRFMEQLRTRTLEKEALIRKLEELNDSAEDAQERNNLKELISTKILTSDDWYTFKKKFLLAFPKFFLDIREKGYQLTGSDERLLALEKLGMDSKEIAKMLGISFQSVITNRYRLRKKLDAPKDVSVLEYLDLEKSDK